MHSPPTPRWLIALTYLAAFAVISTIRPTPDHLAITLLNLPIVALVLVVVRIMTRTFEEADRAHTDLADALASSAARAEALRRLEEEVRHQNDLLLRSAGQGLCIVDFRGRVTLVNPAAARMLGWPAEQLVGRPVHDAFHGRSGAAIHPEGSCPVGSPGAMTASLTGDDLFRRRDGSGLPVEYSTTILREADVVIGAAVVFRDTTERRLLEDRLRETEKRLAYQAIHDPLTGLPNRTRFADRVTAALARLDRHGRLLAVMFLDIDDFGVINDTLGHETGDRLLVEVGRRLVDAVRTGDTVARLGGDEFTLLVEDLGGLDDALMVAERIADRQREPIMIDGREVTISASIGIAIAAAGRPAGAERSSADELIRHADIALDRAKQDGGRRFVVFEESMGAEVWARLDLETDLRHAVERREFAVYYQPILDLPSGRIHEVEALVRWHHPERGAISPLEFIPIAEQAGLIVPIGHLVLEEACRQVAGWQAAFPSGDSLTVGVNLSAGQFGQADLVSRVHEVLSRTRLSAGTLKLEITEGLMLLDDDTTRRTMTALRDLGVRLVLDDFGTGYSALSYLKRFPVDGLKIDRSFVDGLGHDRENQAIVAATIAFGRALGLSVTAEGIETEEQLRELLRLGCTSGQGYLFSKPVSADEMSKLLTSQRAASPRCPTAVPARSAKRRVRAQIHARSEAGLFG
jgi:diguanylate cyclase (GGDEF)-like protein/PAS domain S-box-containing protein